MAETEAICHQSLVLESLTIVLSVRGNWRPKAKSIQDDRWEERHAKRALHDCAVERTFETRERAPEITQFITSLA